LLDQIVVQPSALVAHMGGERLPMVEQIAFSQGLIQPIQPVQRPGEVLLSASG